MLGCTTETGLYLAYRIDLPTAPAKGTEEKQLDATRDYLAEEWNGKVQSEKKVRATGNVGRDFTIKGKPEDGPGVLMVRVRQYLAGKTVYCVTVVSATNKDLPPDTGRFLGSLAIGEAKSRAAGTPEPEPTGTEMKDWGLAIDQDKDCKLTPGDKSLAFEIPGAIHDLNADVGKLNAPRVMREVEGDFVLTVKVAGEFKPGPKSTNPKGLPYIGAGILVWSDSDNHIRLERASLLRAGKTVPHVAFIEREGGYPGANHNEGMKEGDCYLRMERKGSRIQGAISADGKAWKPLKPIDTVWPDKLKLGLGVITTSSEPVTVKFEEVEFKVKEARASAVDRASWTGKTVMQTKPKVTLNLIDGNKNTYFAIKAFTLPVLEEKEGRLQLRDVDGTVGWGNKADFVLLSDATAFFTDLIRKNEKDAWNWMMRAVTLERKGDVDNAIKDYSEAIRLDPKSDLTFYKRGSAWLTKKEYDKAIKDYDDAIRLNPQYAWAHFNRSAVQMLLHRADAVAGFQTVLKVEGWKGELSTYGVIYGQLAARLVSDEASAKQFLKDSADKLAPNWPYPCVQFLRGEIDEPALMKLADDDGKKTEAHCYLGFDHALKGRKQEATAHFRWVKEHGGPEFTEYDIAVAELERLERPSPK